MKYYYTITSNSIGLFSRLLVAAVFLISLAACSLTTERQPLEVKTVTPLTDVSSVPESLVTMGSLKLLSLNLAHGRKDGINQIFQSRQTIRNNLDDIADILKQTRPDLVALQEADGPSRWSGNFDHVAHLAEQADYPWYSRASHASGWLYHYGTALLSRGPFTDVIGHAFEPTPPTMTKGFVLAQIQWQPDNDAKSAILIDIVSVHLDFSRKKVREQQINEMTQVLSGRNNPVIILGDFNSDWFSKEQVIKKLAEQSHLQVYRPDAADLGTYHSNGRRLDWIMISNELEFKNYTVLADVVSDHSAVIAEVGLRQVQVASDK